jgi:peptidoglycan/LPS O-acetylase OafA/YrhL
MMFKKYGKALAAVAGAVLTVAYGALSGDHHIDPDEAVQIAIAAATAVGVYLVPLTPRYRWGKTAIAVILAVLQVLATVILGGLDSNEWIALVLAALTAAGVGAAPAVSSNGVTSRGPKAAAPAERVTAS